MKSDKIGIKGAYMTPTDAINTFKKSNPDVNIVSCKDYGTDFLITAYKTKDEMDPFYLINKNNGSIRNYTIAENLTKYYDTPDINI